VQRPQPDLGARALPPRHRRRRQHHRLRRWARPQALAARPRAGARRRDPVLSTDWTAPGAYEVADGVFRIPLPLPNDGLRAVNVYAIETPEGLVLVDGGWSLPESRHLLAAGLVEIGAHLEDVRQFLVTHMHRDHYTQAVALRRELGSRVGLGEGERPALEVVQRSAEVPITRQPDLLRTYGAPELADLISAHRPDVDLSDWESPDDWLAPGPLPLPGERVLEVVPTPGHTSGHVVFYDTSAALLFAGDHVLPTITPSIGFEPIDSPDPLGAFLRSLAVVRERPDALLLPAHGPAAPSTHARVDELVAHHGLRLDQAEKAVAAGASSAFDVAGVLTWTRRERTLPELDPFNAMLAICETGAHLDLLVAQGRLTVEDVDGVRRYR
jgi:glyoxylase-like metal-dependent hydrolase (beta-lactamase superfamily II)